MASLHERLERLREHGEDVLGDAPRLRGRQRGRALEELHELVRRGRRGVRIHEPIVRDGPTYGNFLPTIGQMMTRTNAQASSRRWSVPARSPLVVRGLIVQRRSTGSGRGRACS